MSESIIGKLGRITDRIEETLIAALLGIMTLITFANVVARSLDKNILWALESSVFLFAWMVLLGASYAVKHSIHIGVDVLVKAVPPALRRTMTLVAVAACLAFSLLLLKGSWDYWYAFVTKRAFLETDDIPMPEFLQFLADALNEGERYEKLPRFIPYAVLPLSMALITWRFVQVAWGVLTGRVELLTASHEVEEILEETDQSDALDANGKEN